MPRGQEDVSECYNPTGTGMQMYGIYCRFKIMLLFFNGSPRENKRDEIWFSSPSSLLPPGCHKHTAQSLSHLTLCNPMDCSVPGSSVHGIFQARMLEWVAISSSRDSSGGHYLKIKSEGGMVTAPGDQREHACRGYSVTHWFVFSLPHTCPQQSLVCTVPLFLQKLQQLKMKSSPSEIYSKADDSMMEGKSTLSALSIYLPAREWQVIKIY